MKTATNIALLPSPEMTTKAVEINHELLKTAEHKIVLNEQDCLPHISLCMGVLDTDDFPAAKAILASIAQDYSPLTLTAESLRANVIANGKMVPDLPIQNTSQLRSLQQTTMDRLWPYLTYEVDKTMLYNPAEVEDITFTWIRDYAKKHDDPSLFEPHITLGFGQTNAFADSFPMQFTASTLALCQLGNYCTCRKVFERFELGARHA